MKVSYQGRFEKENNFNKNHQTIHTRQYANKAVSPSNLRNQIENDHYRNDRHYTDHPHSSNTYSLTPKATKGFRYQQNLQNPRYERQDFSGKPKRDRTSEKYQTFQNYDRYLQKSGQERKQNILKPLVNHMEFQDPIPEYSSHANSFAKRENARAKGLEIKMNNIQTINDKIGNLLSLVKRDRSKTPKKYLDNLAPIALLQGATLSPKNQINSNDLNKHQEHKRIKTYSAYDRKEQDQQYSVKYAKEKHYQFNNQEDKSSPFDKTTQKSKKKPDYKYTNRQTKKQAQIVTNNYTKDSLSKYYRVPTNHQQARASSRDQISSFEARWKNHNAEDQNRFAQRPHPKKSHLSDCSENSFLPYSLQTNNNAHKSYQCTSIIDQRLKQIHQKIGQSEEGKKRIQRRLEERANHYLPQPTEQAKAGQLYRRPPCISNKKIETFQIKVHPVKVDKENIVKMAVALLNQADLDKNLCKLREEFLKEDDQNKWIYLQSQLRDQGVRLTIQEVKELVAIGPEQFSLLQESPRSSCQQLSKLLGLAQKHWESKVCGCVYSRGLKGQGFSQAQIDLDRKGYISQSDILEFIGKYTGKTLVARDIVLIFRRLKFLEGSEQVKGVSFSTFMRVLAL